MIQKLPDVLETNGRGMRFLFRRGEEYLSLFSFSYINDELYIGSSQDKVWIGTDSLGEFNSSASEFGIVVRSYNEEEEYTSLKFSFHASGERHLRATNKAKRSIEFYKEIKAKLTEVKVPEVLFRLVSKRISLYRPYRYDSKTRKGRNAIILDTPEVYLNHKNIFEFYVSHSHKRDIKSPISQGGNDYCVVRLKPGLFLHILFYIISPENHRDNLAYPDREFMLFMDGAKNKYFTFR